MASAASGSPDKRPRPKMRDGLIKRGSTWSYQVWSTDPATGRKKSKWVGGFRTRDLAKDAKIAAEAASAAGDIPAHGDWTVAAWLDYWLPAHSVDLEPSTIRGYRGAIERYLKPMFGSDKLLRLEPLYLATAYARMAKSGGVGGGPLSPRTVQQAAAVMHRAMTDAAISPLTPLKVNPATGAKIPKQKKQKHRTWTGAQLAEFLPLVTHVRLYAVIYLAAFTGARRGEILGLRWRCVDLDAGVIFFERNLTTGEDDDGDSGTVDEDTTKNDEDRTVDVDPDVVAVLKAHRRRQREERLARGLPKATDDDYVFIRPTGESVDPDGVSDLFTRLVGEAGAALVLADRLVTLGAARQGQSFTCPAHDDTGTDLRVEVGARLGPIPVRCAQRCTVPAILAALELTEPELWKLVERRLPQLTLHDLRHTHATLLLKGGEGLHVVSRRLGHRDPTVTLRIYADVQPDQSSRAAETFHRAVFGV